MYEDFVQPILLQLVPIAASLIAAFAGYGVIVLKRFLNEQLQSDKLVWFRETVGEYVRYMEQNGITLGWDSEKKFNFAFSSLTFLRDEYDLPLTDEDIKRMIEAYVNVIGENQPDEEQIAARVAEKLQPAPGKALVEPQG